MKTLLSDAELDKMATQSSMRALRWAAFEIALSILFGLSVYGTANPGYKGAAALLSMVMAWRALTLIFEAFEYTIGKTRPAVGEVAGLVVSIFVGVCYSLFTTVAAVLTLVDVFTG